MVVRKRVRVCLSFQRWRLDEISLLPRRLLHLLSVQKTKETDRFGVLQRLFVSSFAGVATVVSLWLSRKD